MTERTKKSAIGALGAALRAGKPLPRDRKVTLLVATDFSPAADVAVDVAVELAARSGARVVLLHLVTLAPIAHADFVWVPTAQEIEGATRKADAALRATVARIRARETNVEIESVIVDGLLPDDLVGAIADRTPDLVVVGTHGRGYWSNLVLGSVTRAVVRRSPSPVLTVRPEGMDPAATTILAPIELGAVVEEALDFAVGLSSITGGKLRLLYTFPASDELDLDGGAAAASDIALKAQVALEQLAGPERARAMQVESATRFGRPARQISSEAKACRAAFVVMGIHDRSFVNRTIHGSVAEDVLAQAGRAVVTCRAPDAS